MVQPLYWYDDKEINRMAGTINHHLQLILATPFVKCLITHFIPYRCGPDGENAGNGKCDVWRWCHYTVAIIAQHEYGDLHGSHPSSIRLLFTSLLPFSQHFGLCEVAATRVAEVMASVESALSVLLSRFQPENILSFRIRTFPIYSFYSFVYLFWAYLLFCLDSNWSFVKRVIPISFISFLHFVWCTTQILCCRFMFVLCMDAFDGGRCLMYVYACVLCM